MPGTISRRSFLVQGVATLGAALVFTFRPVGGAGEAAASDRSHDEPREDIMPHVSVKLYPGRSEEQKKKLAEALAQDVAAIAGSGMDSISVAIEEVEPRDWKAKVYDPEILGKPGTLYKKPGYSM